MFGTLTQAMCRGIDSCDVVLVCITREYIKKCNNPTNDNCKLELNYAYERQGEHKMLPVVMERACLNQQTWEGPVGAHRKNKGFHTRSGIRTREALRSGS